MINQLSTIRPCETTTYWLSTPSDIFESEQWRYAEDEGHVADEHRIGRSRTSRIALTLPPTDPPLA